ncbi:MAG: HAMP domain-containing histidine kinase [Candidatus Aminicenantes bacterium]|nr:HAMP domain-containing histidine kinase [Candidatus Aminicenantes bacterium]
MNGNKSVGIGDFEKIAEVLNDRCFERVEGKEFKTKYEIRALLVFDFRGHSILVYGDKSGELVIYDRTTEKEIIKVNEKSAIDILEYTILPDNECLLFVGFRFQGIQVYKLKNQEGITAECFARIEGKKFIKLFFQNLIRDKKGNAETIEAAVCYDTGEVEIYDFAYKTAEFALKNSFRLPYCLSAYAVDWDEDRESGSLFIGGSNGDISRIPFMNLPDLRFPQNGRELEEKKILNIGGATVERMIPLSDYRKIDSNGKTGELFYRDNYGVLVVSNNKIICIYGTKSGKSDKIRTSTKVYPQRLFDVKCLCLPGFVHTVASDIEKNLQFIKNITDMEPVGENIEVMFDGEMYISTFESRITRFCFVPYINSQKEILYQAYLGMGDHRVIPFNIFDPASKLAEAKSIFKDIVLDGDKGKESPALTEMENIHRKVDHILDQTRYKKSRTAVKSLLLQLMSDSLDAIDMNKIDKEYLEKNKDIFEKAIYKILNGEQTCLVQQTREVLTKIENKGLLPPYLVNSLQRHIKKFILDGRSFSDKQENLSGLAKINEDSGNDVDAMVYRGILADRQYDRVFCRHIDDDYGEIIGVAPYSGRYLVFTAKGKIFAYDPQNIEKPDMVSYDLNIGDKKIEKFYIGETYIYLLSNDSSIIIVTVQQLLDGFQGAQASSQTTDERTERQIAGKGTAVCIPPGGDPRQDKCLVGTNQGDIYYIEGKNEPKRVSMDLSLSSEILYLRSFCEGKRNFIAAGYWNGSIKVFESFGEAGNIKLNLIDSVQLDAHPVKRIFTLSENRGKTGETSFPLIVAGTGSGRCYGLRLCPENGDKTKLRLIHEWCYVCAGEIKSIHLFSKKLDEKNEDKKDGRKENEHFFLIASQDKHIHVLDENGFSVNTIRSNIIFHNIIMQTYNLSDPARSEVEGYGITTDNDFMKISFYIWELNRKRFNESFDRQYPVERENAFLKYKSINIDLDFFKKYYYRRSKSFNTLPDLIEEMEALEDCGKFEGKTNILTSLIHRLFTQFFKELLENEELFYRLKKIFIRTCAGWDLPGSQNNSRVQLFWIRSMLRGCWRSGNPKEMIKRWFEVGDRVAKKYNIPQANPRNLIKNFVIHPYAFLRVKTLQYFQRFIMTPKPGADVKEDIAKTKLDENVIESITNAIYDLLKMYRYEQRDSSPRWIELEAARFLTWLIRDSEICPIRLCYDLWKNNIPASFFRNLSNAIKIFPGEVSMRDDLDNLFRAAGDLTIEMDRGNPQIEKHLRVLFAFCDKCERQNECNERNIFYKEFCAFSQYLAALLTFKDIEGLRDTSRLDELKEIPAVEELHFFNYKDVINAFLSLYRFIKQYYLEKYNDIYTDEAFQSLQYSTFKNIRDEIKSIRENIDNLKCRALNIEVNLYSHLLDQWEKIILHEVNIELILDFALSVREYKKRCIDYNEPMDLELILKNIFTRLNIMAECDRSYLLYLDDKGKEVIVKCSDGREEKTIEGKERFQKDIPSDWLNAERFRFLAAPDIRARYREQNDNKTLSFLNLETPLLDQVGTQAVYLFFWNEKETHGFKRIESREILGEFITSMAYLFSALSQQQEMREDFFRIVSHELRQILAGISGWVSTLRAGFLENTPDVRQEYYERAYNSLEHAQFVIRGLLSFRDFPRLELKECKLDKEIENPIKLQKIYYKDYRVDLLLEKEDVDYTIVTDPGLVSIALLNLLTNARKYNPDGKPVRINLSKTGHWMIIEIKDQGVGIPKSEYNIIFEKFKRGKYAIDNDIEGFGIGLTVSKNVIEAIGGTVTFKSEIDKGSTFIIALDTNRFSKIQTIVTSVIIKRKPDFAAIEKAELRQKLLDKLEYNFHKKTLELRGFLTKEEYEALRMTFQEPDETKQSSVEQKKKSEKIKQYNLKTLKKLYDEANDELKKLK